MKFFIIIRVYVQWSYIFFALCLLIWLMAAEMFILVIMFVWGFLRWFLWELALFKIIISMVGNVFKCVSILFKMIINVIIFLLWKGVIETLESIDKKLLVFVGILFIDLKVASKKLHQNHLFHTTKILKNDIFWINYRLSTPVMLFSLP